ncbi:MAG TPA: choice-of-anchor tandem repeat GloVer-containing protein [Rhizomicrobium sp.]|nr:choice-of-anchor tandem repeat GloVer-containing protein [Rhizomicrobium sp.]
MAQPKLASTAVALSAALALAVGAPSAARATRDQIIYSFTGGADGSAPHARLTSDKAGNLYGTTSADGRGYGTVFEYATKGGFATLYTFNNGTDGAYANGVTYDEASGNLFGTARQGGANGKGVIFKLTPKGALTVLHAFAGTDGDAPSTRLTRDTLGNFYGAASAGGDLTCFGGEGCGVIFKLAADGTYSVLHKFSGGADGSFPSGRLSKESDGDLVGVTNEGGDLGCGNGNGCGTVFRVTPTGKFHVLHTFTGVGSMGFPAGGVAEDSRGNIYGTVGGAREGNPDFVFKIARNGTYTVLHSFTGADGFDPFGDLLALQHGHMFYGTTSDGGKNDAGTVFRFKPDGSFHTVHTFRKRYDGANPYVGLTETSRGLYGTTDFGGSSYNCQYYYVNGCGTIYYLGPE